MNQHHIIKIQILDITLDSPVGSFTFQSKVGEFFKQEILPILDAYCTAISNDSGVIRIDRLEIDLGVIAKNFFEMNFKRKLAEVFPEKLAKILRCNSVLDGNHEGTVTKEAREFELLEYFIKEGLLPWWAENGSEQDISTILEQVVVHQPVKLKKFISTLVDNPQWIKRLVYHTRDLDIEKILALFQPQDYRGVWKLCQELVKQLVESPLLGTVYPEKLKCEAWVNILSQVIASEGEPFNQGLLIETAVKHIASFSGVDFPQLANDIVKKISLEKRVNGKLFNNFLRNNVVSAENKVFKLKMSGIEKTEYLECLETIDKFLLDLQQGLLNLQSEELTALIQRLLTNELPQIFEFVHKISDILTKAGETGTFALKPFEKAALERQVKKFVAGFMEIRSHLAAIANRKKKHGNHTLNKKLDQSLGLVQRLKEIALPPTDFSTLNAFTATTEFFIANAGLVLLWPYLERFFSNLGLIREKTFVNEDARERAALLLQHLVDNTGKAREYDLMLNKILCGLDPVALINPFLKLAKNETAEGENLLEAVIHNWPALKNLSKPGLRDMFLRREGMIFTRDGQQVLRVTEQAYDILLDQMPWGIGPVKLPWMAELLLVEWRI